MNKQGTGFNGFSNIFAALIILGSGISLFAQPEAAPIDLYIGPELNMANNIQVPEILGHDEKGYYAYSFDYRPAVEFLDTEFRTVRREHLDLLHKMRERRLLALFHFHDTLYMFTAEERFKHMMLYVETIDKETMLQVGNPRLVMDIDNLSGWGTEFHFALSRQENKLLVYSRLDVLSKNIQDLHLEVFGAGLKLEWEADQRIIYERRPPRQSIVKVSEKGDVYIISLMDDQGLRSLWRLTKNMYHLVAVTDNGKYNNNYLINLPGYYIRGVQIEPGKDHDMSCIGFYSPTHFRGIVDGIFYMELDNKGRNFLFQRRFEFEPWFLSEAISGVQKKEPEEMFSFLVRNFIRRENGDFILLAENEFDQTYDTYQNIIAVSISPGGKLNWQKVIPKRQNINTHVPFNYSSFSVHAPKNSNSVHIFFNDDDKNGDWPGEKEIKTFHANDRANLKIISIGPSGEMASSIMYRKTKKRMKTPIPLQYYDMLNNEMVIPMLRYKRYNYMKFSFNE